MTTIVWTHGNSGVLQSNHGFLAEPLGYYLRLKAEFPASTWVHFAVPTILDAEEPGPASGTPRPRYLLGVRIRARTFGDMEIRAVHAWDGARQLIRHDELGVRGKSGGRRDQEDLAATDIPELALAVPAVRLSSAIGVSILIHARQALDAIALVAVGADIAKTRRTVS
jgi:hypothetical protein